MIKAEGYHVPVLLEESVDGLDIKPGGIYLDVTFGGGGHSKEILRRLDAEGRLFGFDQDEDAEKNIVDDERFTFVRSNFRYLMNWMRYYGVELEIDMGGRDDDNADNLYNIANRESDVLYIKSDSSLDEGMELVSHPCSARSEKRLETTGDLMKTTEKCFQREREKKEMAKMFQALRIEVNHEMDALKDMLYAACDLLREGGHLSVITYHSLEDRMVKNMMKAGNVEGKVEQDFFGRTDSPLRQIGSKVIVPSEEEQQRNPRSRSAKLRIAERI